MAFGGNLWNAKGKLEVDLVVVAGRSLGKCREKIEAFGEVGDGFCVGRAIIGAQARLVPVRYGIIDQSALGCMMGKHLRLRLRSVGKAFAEDRGDPAVELLAPALQQRRVGGIPHQCMLEGVDCIRGRVPAKRQFGADEFIQSSPELRLVHLCGRGEQLVAELAADDCADLRYLLNRRQPIEASQERVPAASRGWQAAAASR